MKDKTIDCDIRIKMNVESSHVFFKQRVLVSDMIMRGNLSDDEAELFEGLTCLLDEVADQLHDDYNLPTLYQDQPEYSKDHCHCGSYIGSANLNYWESKGFCSEDCFEVQQ